MCSVTRQCRESLENKTGIWAALQPTEQRMDESDSNFSGLKVTPGAYCQAMTANLSPYSSYEQVTLVMWLHSPTLTTIVALIFLPHFCDSLTHHLKGLFKFPSLAPITKPIRYRMISDQTCISSPSWHKTIHCWEKDGEQPGPFSTQTAWLERAAKS